MKFTIFIIVKKYHCIVLFENNSVHYVKVQYSRRDRIIFLDG